MTWRTVLSATAVVGLCGGAVAAGTIWQAEHPTAVVAAADATGVREFLRSAELTCPQLGGSGADVLVAAASVPGVDGQDDPGEVTISESPEAKPAVTVNEPGATARFTKAPDPTTPVVAAVGGLAPGLVTARVSDDSSGEGKGLASSPCLPATAESWLVGGNAGPGQRNELLLMNPTGTDSQVDVSAYSKGGPLELTGQEGIAVPAGETQVVKLSALAPQADHLAVRVRTTVGLVAAAIVDQRMDGLTPMGTEILTPAGEPRRSQVLAAVPAGEGARELRLIAPGSQSGSVRLTALTDSGELPLLEGEPVTVTGGHLTLLDVTKDLGGRAAAIRIDGDVPVVASVSAATAADASLKSQRAEQVAAAEEALKNAEGAAERREAEAALAKAETADAIDPGEDLAWFGPAADVQVAAVTGLAADLEVTLLVTGTGGDSTVTVGLLPASDGHANRRPFKSVAVPNGATVAVPLDAPAGADRYTAVVTRSSGPGQVRVSHVQSGDGRSLTGYAVGAVSVWVPLPVVVPSYG